MPIAQFGRLLIIYFLMFALSELVDDFKIIFVVNLRFDRGASILLHVINLDCNPNRLFLQDYRLSRCGDRHYRSIG